MPSAGEGGEGAVPHHGGHQFRQRGAPGHRAGLYRTVGDHVDHDAAREEGSPPLQAHAISPLRR